MWKKILLLIVFVYLFLRFWRVILAWLRRNLGSETQKIHLHITHEHIISEKNKRKIKDEGEYVDFEEVK